MGGDVDLHTLLREQISEDTALDDSVGYDSRWRDEQTEEPGPVATDPGITKNRGESVGQEQVLLVGSIHKIR
jgi:hypothetical protein